MSIHPIGLPPFPPDVSGVTVAELHPARGGPQANVRICYSLRGRSCETLTVVLGGISAGSDALNWWTEQVGHGRAIDLERTAVLGFEYIGEWPEGWTAVDTADQANALAAVLAEIGHTDRITLVGASYGGCVALKFSELYPDRVEQTFVLSAADRTSPMTTALRVIQREILKNGRRNNSETHALQLARALAFTTYRTEGEFSERFNDEPFLENGSWHFPVEGYLKAQGERFAGRFTIERYLTLSESLDLHRVDADKLQNVVLHFLAVAEDRVIPFEDVRLLAEKTGGTLHQIHSQFGHDAFLKEADAVSTWLKGWLEVERMRTRVAIG